MKRLVILLPALLALQVGVQPALAWTWPVDGPVLRLFSVADDPYEAGQHRGVDTAGDLGTPVRAPATGTVSFSGTVPDGGRAVTIQTADGYSVTLLHLGAIDVVRAESVAEGAPVGTVGWSGTAEHDRPYVHLGIRTTTDPNGYLDPLTLLPPRAQPGAEPAPEPTAEPEPGPAQAPKKFHGEPQAGRPAPHEVPDPAPSSVATAHLRAAREHVLDPRGLAPRRGPAPQEARSPVSIPSLRTALRGFEQPPELATPGDAERFTARNWLRVWVPLGLAVLAAAAVLVLRRQLRDAGAANGAAPVFLEVSPAPAKDAGSLGLREHDRFLPDGDLERILLAQAEPLPDLDGDDDSAELVEVPDDSGGRGACRPRSRSRRLSRPHRPRTSPFSAGAQA
jgi:hypothetical protein